MKWLEFAYNKPSLTPQRRLRVEYEEDKFLDEFEDICFTVAVYEDLEWEGEEVWNLGCE